MSPVRWRWLGLALLIGLALLTSALLWIGASQTAPRPHPVGPPPAGMNARPVSFPSGSGSRIAGWLFPGGTSAVLLMHGSGGDRRSLMPQARFLLEAGYSVLTIDLQASGESPGAHGTYGYLESFDAHAAVDYLRRTGARRIGALGFSLGGAAALLGPAGPIQVDALVLEAVYPTIEEAIGDRLRIHLGPWGHWLTPLLAWQLRPRTGVGPEQLRPIDRIGQLESPVLIIGGGADRHTTPEETRRLFAAAPEPKSLWIVPQAVHGGCQRTEPEAYRRRVLDFFRRTLGRTARSGSPNAGPPPA